MDLERILKPHEIIERLKNARKQLINGYYFILIRPDMRDRIIELLKESEKERIDIAHEMVSGSILMYQGKELIRCKDCRFKRKTTIPCLRDTKVWCCRTEKHMKKDGFCSEGEKKND